MFLVSDTLEGRRELIRSYDGKQSTLGTLLAVIDFEWTVRRAIIVLAYLPTKEVRQDIERCSGAPAYKEKWKKHVSPRFEVLLEGVVPDWTSLKDGAFIMRHKIVHGVQVTAKEDDAIEKRDIALGASAAICDFAMARGFDIYSKLPVRRKAVELKCPPSAPMEQFCVIA